MSCATDVILSRQLSFELSERVGKTEQKSLGKQTEFTSQSFWFMFVIGLHKGFARERVEGRGAHTPPPPSTGVQNRKQIKQNCKTN